MTPLGTPIPPQLPQRPPSPQELYILVLELP
jgi:hypothetical protein